VRDYLVRLLIKFTDSISIQWPHITFASRPITKGHKQHMLDLTDLLLSPNDHIPTSRAVANLFVLRRRKKCLGKTTKIWP